MDVNSIRGNENKYDTSEQDTHWALRQQNQQACGVSEFLYLYQDGVSSKVDFGIALGMPIYIEGHHPLINVLKSTC